MKTNNYFSARMILIFIVALGMNLSGPAAGQEVFYINTGAKVLNYTDTGEEGFDFNDGTVQGWTLDGAYVEDAGPLPSNFTNGWSDFYNYPNTPGMDPINDGPGALQMYTAGDHGLDYTNNWWIMHLRSPDLSESTSWQNAVGYTVKITEDMGVSSVYIYVNLMVRVYDLDLEQERYFTNGVAVALPHNTWTEKIFIWPGLGSSFPSNYIVREVFVNLWGWIPYGPWLDGGVYLDEVTPIEDENYIYVDDDGGGPGEDGSRTDPFDTIQEGIDAAQFGKTVIVRDGTYRGTGNRDVDFNGMMITVQSENGPDNCIIDCQGSPGDNHRGFYFHNLEDPNSVLRGITISNGYAGYGGGIYCQSSNPTIQECIFSNNTAVNQGGGIFIRSSSPTIDDCIFSRNEAAYGGGINCESGGNAIIGSCVLVQNSADYGGGISCENSTPILSTVTIANNTADVKGGAVYCDTNGNPVISNSIIWANTPDAIFHAGGTAGVTYTDIQGGWADKGNINQDPQLKLDYYHLEIDSPCIDLGDPNGTFDGQTDIDGHPRIIDGRVDMGADEFSRQIHNQTQDTYHYTIQEAIDSAQPNDTIVVEDGVYTGYGNRDINFKGREITLQSENGPDNCIIDCGASKTDFHRGFHFNHPQDANSILDGFTIRQGYSLLGGGIWCIYSSPTIQNCKIIFNTANDDGGGIMCSNCDPTIINCTIHSNTTHYGGGISFTNSSARIYNCTLHSNTADWGGGLYVGHNSSPMMINSIMWGDTATYTGPEIALGGKSNPSTLQVSYCVIEGGSAAATVDTGCALSWGVGNLNVDPEITPDGHLNAGSPCLNAGTLTGAPAFDRENETRPHGVGIDIGSDEFIDTDGDGLPDWWETRYFGTSIIALPGDDPDNDGLTNLQEYELFSSHPMAPVYYVDDDGPGDLWPGDPNTSDPLEDGSAAHPFDSIQEAIDAADDGDTILAAAGTYTGAGNKDLDFLGKLVILRAPDGPTATVIDCEDEGRGFYFHSGETPAAAIIGFTITNGQATLGGAILSLRSHFQMRNCLITENNATYGGGLFCRWSMLTLADGEISNNSSDGIWMLNAGGARIYGTVQIISNDWLGKDLRLTGQGALQMSSDTTLDWDNTRVRCDLSGAGTIKVDYGTQLVIEGDAVVDLSNGGPNGAIQCDGLLHVKDNVRLSNANINVTRASFEGDVNILNNVINAEAGAPYGQFFIEDSVQITGNEIHADGDRFMDLDASVFDGLIKDNRIYVTITEGVGHVRGGLLELRGVKDMVESYICDPNNPFFCRVAPGTIPDFDPNSWMIEELKLIDDAKVNLTNRFDFQPPYDSGGNEEVIYVKNLILGAHAVLNTSFNRIYYENLVAEPNSIIKNVPLLGFSLSNIALDNDVEFITRVVHDNYIDEETPAYNRIHIERVDGLSPDPGGMMRMRNLEDLDPASPTYGQLYNARAKGLFAKAGEDQILILFEYLFCSPDPNMDLVVYLSDVPEIQDPRDPNHYLEVARLPAPPTGRPGAYGSGRFGVLQATVSSGNLNFIRGVRMELELLGPEGSCILINNWDPMVLCDPMQFYCKDVTGEFGVTAKDFLYIFGEYGNIASPTSDLMAPLGRSCLDGAFNKNGYVDMYDLMEWDWFVSPSERLNLCDIPLVSGQTSSSSSSYQTINHSEKDSFYFPLESSLEDSNDLEESFLISSKRILGFEPYLQDSLYLFNRQGQSLGPVAPAYDHKGGRLVRDKQTGIYQINMEHGLVAFWDPNVILAPPGQINNVPEPRFGSLATVCVGLQTTGDDWYGRPIFDAAFDAQGCVYVVPVLVIPSGSSNNAYLAAAKLQPQEGQTPPYNVVQLYDDPPPPGDNQQRNALREIEVDDDGNVYIINSHQNNESDILWVYDADTGLLERRLDLNLYDPNIPAPLGLHVSDTAGILYLASSQNNPDADTTTLYGLASDDLALQRTVTITGLGHVTDITEDPDTGTIWAVGFKMVNIPQYPDPSQPPFYYPFLAQIPSDSDEPVQAAPLSGAEGMTLPMSIVWIGGGVNCAGADVDGNGQINLADFYIMVKYWLAEDCTDSEPCAKVNLDNSDNNYIINLADFAVFAQYWLWPNCKTF